MAGAQKKCMERICPRCGKSSKEAEFAGEFCTGCYPVEIKCPHSVEVARCSRCERLLGPKGWVKEGEFDFDLLLKRNCKGKFDSVKFDAVGGIAVFWVRVGKEQMKIEKKVELRVQKGICTDCTRKTGGYFEGNIQLRGEEKKVQRFAIKIANELEKKSFIAKIEELKEGIDIYFGNRNAAIEALNKFSLPYYRTEKLAGERNGKRLYRTTLLVRLGEKK